MRLLFVQGQVKEAWHGEVHNPSWFAFENVIHRLFDALPAEAQPYREWLRCVFKGG
jgi:hypothetical protein